MEEVPRSAVAPRDVEKLFNGTHREDASRRLFFLPPIGVDPKGAAALEDVRLRCDKRAWKGGRARPVAAVPDYSGL